MFTSQIGQEMTRFLEFKKSLGYSESTYLKFLIQIDRFLLQHENPETLDRQMVEKWIELKNGEQENGRKRRMNAIRVFAIYLSSKGIDTYIVPSEMIGNYKPYTPFIFSDEQLCKFLAATDGFEKSSHSPIRHLLVPAYFRLTLSCGLRPNEGKNLKQSDLDFKNGLLTITNSKSHKDRVIPVDPDVLEFCRRYDRAAEKLYQNRAWFFITPYGNRPWMEWFQNRFHDCMTRAEIYSSDPKPRIFDLRHNFATRKLQQWLDAGLDINGMLPYLSQYMGHTQLSDTAYYIHLLPERLVKSQEINWTFLNAIIPEVKNDEP